MDSSALRDYQQETLVSLVAYRRAGGQRALVALPTGTGKTVVFAQVPRQASKRVLVLVHRDELVRQTVAQMRDWNPDIAVGIEKAQERSKGERVIVASVQTLAASRYRRVRQFPPEDFSVVIVDEAHHATASSYMGVLAHFGLAPDVREFLEVAAVIRKVNEKILYLTEHGRLLGEQSFKLRGAIDRARKALKAKTEERIATFTVKASSPYLMGFTATPSRTDGTGLEAIFDEIVYSRSIREMMEAGWLAPLQGRQVVTNADISGVHSLGGDYIESELAEAVNIESRNKQIVQAFAEYAPNRQALCFAVDVKHTFALRDSFLQAGVQAVAITGETPVPERAEAYRRYAAREIRVLVNCMVLTEGFDAPATDCLLMARPTKSKLLYTQMLGRGTRRADGKTDCTVIDFVDNAKVGVVGLNVLFGLPPNLVKIPDVLKALFEEEESRAAKGSGKVKSSSREGAFDPLAEEVIAHLGGSLVWVQMPAGYATSTFSGLRIGIVENLLGRWDVKVHHPGTKPVLHESAENIAKAVLVAETYVRETEGEGTARALASDAQWRAEPPTEKQLELAKKWGIPVTEETTKGGLSALIDVKMAERNDKPVSRKQLWWFKNQFGVELPQGTTTAEFRAAIKAQGPAKKEVQA